MLNNYLKIALRTLWNSRLYSLLNVGGLAMGVACCLLIALFVTDELSYDRFHAHYTSIYRVAEKQKQPEGVFDVAVTPGPLAASLKKDFPEVLETTRVGRWPSLLTQGRTSVEAEQTLVVDPSFFSLFSFGLVAGNPATVFRSPDEVILSERMAEQIFGKAWRRKNILGQALTLNREHTLTLVGIARNPPTQSHIQFDVLLPFKWLEKIDEWSGKWGSNSFHTYVQLRPDPLGAPVNLAAFNEKIRYQIKRQGGNPETQLYLQPLSEVYLYSKFWFETDWGQRSDILYIQIFIAVGLVMLLIAIINFINLSTARATYRAKEIGVRKTVGAGQASLIAQFLGEALLMTSLAVVVALMLVEILLPAFNNLTDKTATLPYANPVFWLLLLGLTGAVTLLTGLYPAFFLTSFRPVRVLKGVLTVPPGRGFRQLLVVVQFALSTALVIGALVIQRQLSYLENANLGFDKSHLLYVRLKGELRSKGLLFKNQVEQLPGVSQATVATSNLTDINNSSTVEWEGQQSGDEFHITQMNVDADFLKTTGMRLASGRNFSARLSSDTSSVAGVYLINETAARRMGWTATTALGKSIKFWGTDGKVIGVLKDFHFRPLHHTIEPFMLRFRPKEYYFTLLVRTEPGSVPRTVAEVSRLYKKLEPDHPIQYGFVNQDIDAQYKSEQRTGRIILYFSVLTILVSCLGLFGLATFMAEQRTKEIGIRKVLGASVASVVALLSKDFLKLVLIAIVIASPVAAWAMGLWLQNFAYRIDMEWWMYALAGLLAVGIALLTVSFQSVKAALANPANSLRKE